MDKQASPAVRVMAVLKMDPLGVLWFVLSFSVLLVTKWLVLEPILVSEQNCLSCVLALLLFLSVLITLSLSVFWRLWENKRQHKGIVFLFLFTIAILVCAIVYEAASQYLLSQIYYGGMLRWQESQISFLMDDFIKHSAGLYLAVLMMYSMARISFCKSFVDRKYVLAMNIVFFLTATILLFLGMLLY